MVIELANEVRKVLGMVGTVKEKKLVGRPHILPSHISSAIQLHVLPEAITLDS